MFKERSQTMRMDCLQECIAKSMLGKMESATVNHIESLSTYKEGIAFKQVLLSVGTIKGSKHPGLVNRQGVVLHPDSRRLNGPLHTRQKLLQFT